MEDDPVSRILKMVEDGKLSAADAEKLIAALRAPRADERSERRTDVHEESSTRHSRESTERSRASGRERSYEFRWGRAQGKGPVAVDLASLSRHINDLLSRLDPEKLVAESVERGRRWQQRAREWARAWPDSPDVPPGNTRGWPSSHRSDRRDFDVAARLCLQVSNPAGDVVVVGGAARATLEASIEAWGATDEEARARVEEVQIETELEPPEGEIQQGGSPRLRVRVITPPDWREGLVHLLLRVPADTRVEVSTTFGEVRTEAVEGDVRAETTSGSIVLDSVEGAGTVETVSGHIRAHKVNGPLTVTGQSGDITVEDLRNGARLSAVSGMVRLRHVEGASIEARTVSGNVEAEHAGVQGPTSLVLESVSGDLMVVDATGAVCLKTVSGDVDVRRVRPGELHAETVSGDMRVLLDEPFSGRLSITSVSGDVQIRVPEGGSFRYVLKSRSGRVDCSVPALESERSATEARGAIGSAEGSLEVTTLSGDIALNVATVPAEP